MATIMLKKTRYPMVTKVLEKTHEYVYYAADWDEVFSLAKPPAKKFKKRRLKLYISSKDKKIMKKPLCLSKYVYFLGEL